jgi:hypothetical protein
MNLFKRAAASAMMVLLSSTALLAADPGATPAQTPITPEQAMAAQGQNVTVEGMASLSDANGMPAGLFIRLSTTGPGAAFAGYISADNQGNFPGLTTIPIIRITSPDQIRIVQ